MRTVTTWLWAACLVCSIPAALIAQTEPKPLPAPRSNGQIPSRPLLQEPVIQREIGLTNRQRDNLGLIEAEASDARQEGGADAGEEGFDFNAMMGGIEETTKQQRSAVAKLLTSAQKSRLTQIECQREGWLALGRPDVAARIKLSASQKQEIRTIIDKLHEQRTQAMFAPPAAVTAAGQRSPARPKLNPSNGFLGDPDEVLPGGGPMNFTPDGLQAEASRNLELAAKLQTAAAVEVNKILTPEQRTAFDRLLGPPFDFQSLNASATPTPGTPRPAGTTSKRFSKGR